MNKRILSLILALVLVSFSAFSAFAGDWVHDHTTRDDITAFYYIEKEFVLRFISADKTHVIALIKNVEFHEIPNYVFVRLDNDIVTVHECHELDKDFIWFKVAHSMVKDMCFSDSMSIGVGKDVYEIDLRGLSRSLLGLL